MLEVTLIDRFAPSLGDTFDLFDFSSITGTFDEVVLPKLGHGMAFSTDSLLANGSITIIPEPSTAGLLLMTIFALSSSRRRVTQRTLSDHAKACL